MDNPDPIDLDVGARMRIRRKPLDIRQTDLAEHPGVREQDQPTRTGT
jgi:hypothetical protein